MLNTTAEYLSSFRTAARHIVGSISYIHGGTTYTPNNLKSFKIERATPQGKLFGFAIAQKITIEVLGVVSNIQKGDKIIASVGIKDATSNVDLPNFYIESYEYSKVNNITTIIGYDIIGKSTNLVIGDIVFSYPITLKGYAQKVVAALGGLTDFAGVSYNLASSPNLDGSETLQYVLGAIAEASACICYVPYGDTIRFKTLSKTVADTIEPDHYYDFTAGETISITRLASVTELGDNVLHGTAGYTHIMRDNPFVTLADNISSILSALAIYTIGLTNTHYSLEWRGCPAYEVGDLIAVKEKDGTTKNIYYFNDTLSYTGGLKSTADWEVIPEENIEGAPSNLGAKLKQTYAKVDKVNQKIELVAGEVSQLIIDTEGITSQVQNELSKLDSKITQTASNLTTNFNNEIDKVESQISQTASNINTTINNKVSQLQSEISQTESSISSTISQQNKTITEIRQDLDGIDITYNSTNGTASITIGDVTVSNLVNGTYVDKKVAGINLNGYVTFTDLSTAGETTISGNNITTGTISADRINMTGAIAWSDLSSSCRNTISGLVTDPNLPSYLQSTYIDATKILSPTIEGGSLTSTSVIDNNTHNTVIEDSAIDFWIRESGTGSGSFGYKAGYIKAYANDTGTASSARTGLIIKAPWDGSSYSGGLTLSASRGLVIQSENQDIFFYTPQYPDGLSLTALASGSGGSGGSSTAVFG